MKKRFTPKMIMMSVIVTLLTMIAVPTMAAPAEKVIKIGLWSPPGNMSAINADTSYSYFIVRFLYDSMAVLERDTSLTPRLADAWDISEDGRTYTFHLNPRAAWHDGTPLTAEDVLFTIETVATPGVQTNRGSALRAIEGLDDNGKKTGDTISGVKIIDDHTVAVTTKSAVDPARFLEQFGAGLWIIPKHILQDLAPEELARADALLKPAIGSGPFRFVKYVTDQYIELERNENYFRGPANIDRIFIRIVPAASTAAQLIKGEIDLLAGQGIGEVPLPDWELVQKAEGIRPVTEPSLQYQFMSINNLRPYLQDARVRKAIALAINRELMVNQLYRGEAAVARGPFSPITPYDNADIDPIPYDPDAARALLQEAGWDKNQVLELLVPTGNKEREQTGSIIQANLQAVGIQARIQQLDMPTTITRVFSDAYDLALFGWSDTFDPDHVRSCFGTGGQYNMAGYSNPEVDALIEAASSERDPAQRKVLYDQMQVLFQEEVPVVFLYYPNMLAAVSDKLLNADPSIVPFEALAVEWDIKEAE